MKTLTTIDGDGHKLVPDAAESFARMAKAHGPFPVTSAWRSVADQQALYDGYKAGRKGFNFALPPSQSNHCKGTAVDFGDAAFVWLEAHAAAYGWIQDANERWHFLHVPSKDRHRPKVPRTDVRPLQRALGADDDDVWGPDSAKRARAVRSAARLGTFPFGVKYTQRVVGTPDDGVFGKNSKAALAATVKRVQQALGLAAEDVIGVWGPKTEKAYTTLLKGARRP